MSRSQIVDRQAEGDLTKHVCARCMRPITGPAVMVESFGMKTFVHIDRCEIDAQRFAYKHDNDMTGEAVEQCAYGRSQNDTD